MGIPQNNPARERKKLPTASDLKEKIFCEFEIFYLAQMSTSKDNIFSHSSEIELKKNLRNRLAAMAGNLADEQILILMYQDNVLESAYRFCMDKKAAVPNLAIDRLLKAWLRFAADRP